MTENAIAMPVSLAREIARQGEVRLRRAAHGHDVLVEAVAICAEADRDERVDHAAERTANEELVDLATIIQRRRRELARARRIRREQGDRAGDG